MTWRLTVIDELMGFPIDAEYWVADEGSCSRLYKCPTEADGLYLKNALNLLTEDQRREAVRMTCEEMEDA